VQVQVVYLRASEYPLDRGLEILARCEVGFQHHPRLVKGAVREDAEAEELRDLIRLRMGLAAVGRT
jgi:hypothetical protein